ncbi:hypothetical protein [Spirosoma aerophilum]
MAPKKRNADFDCPVVVPSASTKTPPLRSNAAGEFLLMLMELGLLALYSANLFKVWVDQ